MVILFIWFFRQFFDMTHCHCPFSHKSYVTDDRQTDTTLLHKRIAEPLVAYDRLKMMLNGKWNG